MKFKMHKIAVVSMAGVFPGADAAPQFLQNILNKRESVITVPPGRWVAPAKTMVCPVHTQDRAISDKAGLITRFQFDPAGFQVDKDLLANLDPVHHFALTAGQRAIESCHITRELKQRTGVILAAIALPTDTAARVAWEIMCADSFRVFSPQDAARAAAVSAPAAILARAMGFHGGSFTLDAACASSLYAIKLACQHLSLKKADIMVAGGVSRPDPLYTQVGFTQLQALSPTGCCAPFDKNANGLVVGEGAGILVLKRLEDAIACRDTIHAVITGTGASNDLEGNLVGPASEGQIRAMQAAYDQAGITPADIQYMECHGSGTPVGDQIEATSIKQLLAQYNCPDKRLSIGSIKSMIGHLLTAAGAAGVIKTVLAMNKGCLPPSLNFTTPPDNSPLNHSRIKVQTQVEPWEPEQPGTCRKAGVSAFGFGGINAHILVEEFLTTPALHFVPEPMVPTAAAPSAAAPPDFKLVPCAVVGMETLAKNAANLESFKHLIFGKTDPETGVPGSRWRHTRHLAPGMDKIQAAFMDEIRVELGEFHIPPNQLEDILPQHLIMLKAAKGALTDAGISPRPPQTEPDRTKTGCAIGIEFDFGATDFFLRWKLEAREKEQLNKDLLDKIGPELNFNRTLGALGGIVASRIAREFKLGGPCFTLSAGAASGIKTLETAVHSLSAHETDTFLCGCVDLAGDIRTFTLNQAANPPGNALPSEGACALVLKRLDTAIRDKDRIYGIIKGIGGSAGAPLPGETQPVQESETPGETTLARQYIHSLDRALEEAGTPFSDLLFIDTHATGTGSQGTAEARALARMALSQPQKHDSISLACTASVLGDTSGASSLFSIIASSLSLYHKIVPKSAFPQNSKFNGLDGFTTPGTCQPWQAAPKNPNKAVVGSITLDGACAHVVVEEYPAKDQAASPFSIDAHVPASKPEPAQKRPVFKIKTSRPPMILKMDTVKSDTIEPPGKRLQKEQAISLTDPALFADTVAATARTHERFLEFSSQNMAQMEQQFKALVHAAAGAGENMLSDTRGNVGDASPKLPATAPSSPAKMPVFLDRDKCLEYAVGKAGKVLGPAFDIIDTYPVRVRLPAEPLMLVDRIMDIQGEMLSLKSGKIITQHDVLENAWYLDGGRAPVSISIEAGQADLFLCAYLGIDHAVKGRRKYRLLDAKVTFHRPLPVPHETIEYHIEIDRFLKQGDVYLFFFHYKGYIDTQLFISMRDGCAGFFTESEVKNSGGILLKQEDLKPIAPKDHLPPLVPMDKTDFSQSKIQALRQGDLETAFGRLFKGIRLGKNQWLPRGKMTLIDRIIELDPAGGRFGMGTISAEADIHPDDWFLTCHFIDDMVMPGTLMYECCAHTLRVFVQRMGWVSEDAAVHYDVIPLNESDLKCRGPVTRETKIVRYTIEIKEMGYSPEPYVIADAHMFSDDLQIVLYKDMGMKLCNITQGDLMTFWRKR
jgi:acyl transferase domain-containing protein/3-hydroxymyristoyl/3-hydroxydecanoyl-(acyl carrier protein) dehydratase